MLERYQEILSDVRSPERVASFGRLVNVLMDNNYSDDLVGIEDIIATSNDSADTAINTEVLITNCTYTLLNKIGIEITRDDIYRTPDTVADILETILDSVDNFDDYDTMLQILQNEENSTEAIGCLVGFVVHSSDHKYIEILQSVYDGTIKKLVSVLTARAVVDLDQSKEIDVEIVEQLVQFREAYPQSPVLPLLLEYGYLLPDTEIASSVEILDDGNRVGDYATSVVGILYTKFKTFEEAYERLEYLAEYMIGDDVSVNVNQVLLNASDILDTLFKNKGSDA